MKKHSCINFAFKSHGQPPKKIKTHRIVQPKKSRKVAIASCCFSRQSNWSIYFQSKFKIILFQQNSLLRSSFLKSVHNWTWLKKFNCLLFHFENLSWIFINTFTFTFAIWFEISISICRCQTAQKNSIFTRSTSVADHYSFSFERQEPLTFDFSPVIEKKIIYFLSCSWWTDSQQNRFNDF